MADRLLTAARTVVEISHQLRERGITPLLDAIQGLERALPEETPRDFDPDDYPPEPEGVCGATPDRDEFGYGTGGPCLLPQDHPGECEPAPMVPGRVQADWRTRYQTASAEETRT